MRGFRKIFCNTIEDFLRLSTCSLRRETPRHLAKEILQSLAACPVLGSAALWKVILKMNNQKNNALCSTLELMRPTQYDSLVNQFALTLK